jgi:Ion channel
MDEEKSRPPGFGARRGMSLPARIRGADSYGLLLLLIAATLILVALAERSAFAQVVVLVLQGTVLLFAFWTTRSGRRLFRTALVVVPVAVVVAAVLNESESDAAAGIVALSSAALLLSAIGAIVRRLVAHARIDAATILGALSTYLLIGDFFASVYAALEAFGDASFFVSEAAPTSVDFFYFSFITMTTVGYGDFTAATDLGRMLAVSQALIGQLYLVTVVSLVIGNIGRGR